MNTLIPLVSPATEPLLLYAIVPPLGINKMVPQNGAFYSGRILLFNKPQALGMLLNQLLLCSVLLDVVAVFETILENIVFIYVI